jgi:hypothetical protein
MKKTIRQLPKYAIKTRPSVAGNSRGWLIIWNSITGSITANTRRDARVDQLARHHGTEAIT